MSNNSKDNIKKNKDLDQSQNNQNVVGDASDNPETTGPTENLREEAAKQQIILPTKRTSINTFLLQAKYKLYI